MDKNQSRVQLILLPAAITLAISLLRLVGELQGWSPALFSAEAGGAGVLVGIAWLVPLFGVYFAYRLASRSGEVRPGRLALYGVGGILVITAFAALSSLISGIAGQLSLIAAGSVLSIFLVMRAWPELGMTLLVYAFAARLPVVIIMAMAMAGQWGTHYDALPPGSPDMGFLGNFFWYGIVPQFTIWIAYTVVVGTLTGALGVLLARRAQPALKTA